jgi:hypothetical protein
MATCYGRDADGNIDPVCNKYQGWRTNNNDVGSKFAMQNDNYLEFQPWEQEVLIQWHRMDPVSEKEIKRADAVSNFQHNRNPFIDYPGLEDYIWGDKQDVAFSYDNYATGIQDIMAKGLKEGKQDTKIYGADGQLHRTYQHGVNIVKQKNGRTRKVIKK